MPLFGKKKTEEKEELSKKFAEEGAGSYPRHQQPSQPPPYSEAIGAQSQPRLATASSFDSGARFTNFSPPSIPPPPPGVAPHPAQVANMAGMPVQMDVAKTKFKEPTSNGGYCFWWYSSIQLWGTAEIFSLNNLTNSISRFFNSRNFCTFL